MKLIAYSVPHSEHFPTADLEPQTVPLQIRLNLETSTSKESTDNKIAMHNI